MFAPMDNNDPAEESSGSTREGVSLPVSRAFVMQLTPDTMSGAGRFHGRVEHIESGRAHRFGSLDDLMAFIAEVLETSPNGAPEDGA
jgi:hypothetical protein